MANFNATRIAVAGGGATYTPMQGGGNMAMASGGNTPGTPSEVFGAQVGFAVDAYAQNQRLLDIINAQYDTKVAQLKKQQEAAKTTAEQARLESKINALESERTSALDKQAKINEDNFQAMMDSIKASGKIDDLTIEALNAKLDKLYEAAPEMAVLAKDAMKKAFEGDNVKVGFEIASGQLDAVTAQKLVGLMADPNSGKKVQASYDTIISNSGDAAAIELAQALVAAGATDQQIGIVLEMAATGDIKSITTATELLSQLETFTGVNLGTSTQTIGQISDLVTALQEASKASADVNLNASGFEEANQFVQDLGLLDNLKAATKEQQISYIVSVETMIRSQNKYTQEFLDWQNQPGNAGKSFSDFVFAKLGSPSDFSSTESKTAATTVAGKFVQGGGGGTPVDKLQQKIDKRQKALDVIALKEDKINKKYDDRKEALQKIADLNKEVADQQKAQLGIAEALASGDIAGAARAMQAYQEQAAQNAMSQQNRALEQARQNELNNVSFNGMNRADLEAQLADLQMQMAIRDYNNVGKQTGGGGGGGYYQKGEKPNYVPDGYDPSGKWVWNGKDWKWQGPKLKPVINEANTTNTLTTAVGTKPVMPDVSGMESYVADALMESYNKRLAEFQAANLKWASDNLSAVNGVKNALGLTSGEMAKMPFEELKQKIKDAGGVIDGNVAKIGGFKISLSNLEEVLKTLKTNANNATNPVTYAAQALWDLQNSQGKSKGPRPKTLLAMGGMVKPMLYRGLGGIAQSMGTDSVPALLTPGEFVIKRSAVKKYGIDNLKAINSGSSPADSSSVYNYNVTINAGSNASADDIARTVMTKIKQVESQRVRGNRY
jgi:hypothetical protein